MDATKVMRGFHSMIRSQLMDETKDEETREKLSGMNYLSSVPFGQNLLIPSNFLMPVLKPRDLTPLDDRYSSAVVEQNGPYVLQSPDAPHPV